MSVKLNTAALNSTSDKGSPDANVGPLKPNDVAGAYRAFKHSSELAVQLIEFLNSYAGPSTNNAVIDDRVKGVVPVTVNLCASDAKVTTVTASASRGMNPVISVARAVGSPITLASNFNSAPASEAITTSGPVIVAAQASRELVLSAIERAASAPVTVRVGYDGVSATLSLREFIETTASDLLNAALSVQRKLHQRLSSTAGTQAYEKNLKRYSPARLTAAHERLDVLRDVSGRPILNPIGLPSNQAQDLSDILFSISEFPDFV